MTAFLRRYFAGGGTSTTLAGGMASGDTSFTISSATGWPGASGSFGVVIDRGTGSEEKIICASNATTTVTVATSGRGADGTSATTHNAGATVSLCALALDFDEANQISHLLGNGTVGQVLGGGGAGTLPTWGAAASFASLSVTNYAPTTVAGYILNATTFTALDTTNLTTASFTVPASGRIKVTLALNYTSSGNDSIAAMGMKNHSGGANVGPIIQVQLPYSGVANPGGQMVTVYYITGLTPSSTLQLDLAGTYSLGMAVTVSAKVSATPSVADQGPATIIIDAA